MIPLLFFNSHYIVRVLVLVVQYSLTLEFAPRNKNLMIKESDGRPQKFSRQKAEIIYLQLSIYFSRKRKQERSFIRRDFSKRRFWQKMTANYGKKIAEIAIKVFRFCLKSVRKVQCSISISLSKRFILQTCN